MLQTYKKMHSGKALNISFQTLQQKTGPETPVKGSRSHVFYLLFRQYHSVIGEFLAAGLLEFSKKVFYFQLLFFLP